jgi:hypothetical protein
LISQQWCAKFARAYIYASIDKLRNLSVRGRRIPLDRDINYQFATRLAHAAAINSPIFGGGHKFCDVPLMKILVSLGRHEMRAPLIFYTLCVYRAFRVFNPDRGPFVIRAARHPEFLCRAHAVIGGKLAAGRAL